MTKHSIAQSNSVSIEAYKSVEGLKLVELVQPQDLIGKFTLQAGSFEWLNIELDSTMKYTIKGRGCLGQHPGALNGTWSISYSRLLTLHTSARKEIFDVLKFRGSFYLVDPIRRREFIEQLKQNNQVVTFYSKPIN